MSIIKQVRDIIFKTHRDKGYSWENFSTALAHVLEQNFSASYQGYGSWNVQVYLSPENPDLQSFRQNLEQEAQSFLKEFADDHPHLREKIDSYLFFFSVIEDSSKQAEDGEIKIEAAELKSSYKLTVYCQKNGMLQEIESVFVSAENPLTIGRYNQQYPCDIFFGMGDNKVKYPLISKERRLIDIMSRQAFSLFPKDKDQWFCQVRRQGDFLFVRKQEKTRQASLIQWPLEHPMRWVHFSTEYEIVLIPDRHDWKDEETLIIRMNAVEEEAQ